MGRLKQAYVRRTIQAAVLMDQNLELRRQLFSITRMMLCFAAELRLQQDPVFMAFASIPVFEREWDEVVESITR